MKTLPFINEKEREILNCLYIARIKQQEPIFKINPDGTFETQNGAQGKIHPNKANNLDLLCAVSFIEVVLTVISWILLICASLAIYQT